MTLSPRFLIAAAFAAGIAGGFAAASLLRSDSVGDDYLRQLDARLERIEASRGALPPSTTVAAAFDSPALRREIRQMLQEELRAFASTGAGSASPAAKPEPPPPSAESVAATEQAHRLLEAAATARRWTDRDREQLRVLLPQLTNEQRQEILTSLIPAVNRGDIKVETTGSIY
jgi:hypothetical protein